MSIFLILLVIGMSGLLFMAMPAFSHHAGGHIGGHDIAGGHHLGDLSAGAHHAGHVQGGHTHSHDISQGSNSSQTFAGIIPSPRTLFSLLAMFGSFGYVLQHLTPYSIPIVSGLALLPTYLVERFIVTPLWNLLVSFSSPPVAPLQTLTLLRAVAVTPFTNGKGMVSVVREGREVQFLAQLVEEQSGLPVQQGDMLYVDEVDDAKERLTVRIR